MKQITAIVLAAGRGTRLNSTNINKVMRPLAGKPMIGYTVNMLKQAGIDDIITIVGFSKEGVMDYLGDQSRYVEQKDILGTGHAVLQALPALGPESAYVLILQGDDSAFYPASLIQAFIKQHLANQAELTFATVIKDNPTGLGRIIRDDHNRVLGIREEKNCSPEEKTIKEINAGCYLANTAFLRDTLPKIQKNPVSGEYYLTDLVEIGLRDGKNIDTFRVDKPDVSIGINTPEELEFANQKMFTRRDGLAR